MKKRVVACVLGFVVFVAIAFVQGGSAQTTLTINSFGGAYEEAHRKLVIEPFEKMYNVKVRVVTAYSADALAQLRAQKDKQQFDVIHFSGDQEVIAAREGLVAPIPAAKLTHYKDMYPFAVSGLDKGWGPVISLTVLGMVYNTEKAKPAPKAWKDIFRPEFKDRLMLTDVSNTYGLLGLLMINKIQGGSLDDIQPGLAAVKKLLNSGAMLVSKSPEIQQNFAQGNAWIAPYAQDYAYTLRKANLPVDFVLADEGAPAVYITASLVAGRPTTDLALKFIDFSLRPEAQVGWASALRYSPTNRMTKLPADLAKEVFYGEEAVKKLIKFDGMKINTDRPKWTEAWNQTVAK
jgi:putative spermidine/putrescine transport system substrate-binding protein